MEAQKFCLLLLDSRQLATDRSRLITEIYSNAEIVRSVDETHRYLDRVVQNEIFQNSDIPLTENYNEPNDRGVEKTEPFQNTTGMLDKQDRTMEIRKSI